MTCAPAVAIDPVPLPPLGPEYVNAAGLGVCSGIIRTVNLLRAHGFETRDSWDGPTKSAPSDDESTYVHCAVDPDKMVSETHRMCAVLKGAGITLRAMDETGEPPFVEASFSPFWGEDARGGAIISLFNVNDAMLGAGGSR
jgi:hypothetical protein